MEYSWKFMSNKKHVNWFFFNMNFYELTMNFLLMEKINYMYN